MKQRLAIGIIVLLIGFVAINYFVKNDVQYGVTSEGTGLDSNEVPPQFLLKTIEGNELSLEEYKGKKVILNFWATWCKPCREEMPAFEAFKQQRDDVVVIAVNMTYKDSSVEKVNEFLTTNDLTFPVVLDEKGDVSKAYNVINIPSTYFLDEEGKIIQRVEGAVKIDQLTQYVK